MPSAITHRRSCAVQSAAPRVVRMTCSSHGLALGLSKTHCLLPRVAPHYPSLSATRQFTMVLGAFAPQRSDERTLFADSRLNGTLNSNF